MRGKVERPDARAGREVEDMCYGSDVEEVGERLLPLKGLLCRDILQVETGG
jgi:hypothetical protein